MQRIRRDLNRHAKHSDDTPYDQDYNHHGGDDHDLHGLLAGLVHALGIFFPEVEHHNGAKRRRKAVLWKRMKGMTEIPRDIFDEARQILACSHGADRTSQYVIKKQRRDRDLGQRASHGFLYHAIDATSHEHAAGLDIQRPHRITEQHYRQNEPGRGLANNLLCVATSVVRG